MRKTAIRVLLAAALIVPALGVVLWWKDHRAAETETYTVERGELLAGVTVSGSVHCTEKMAVSAEIQAVVDRIAVEEGQTVGVGDVLIDLDDRVIAAECAKSRARVSTARQRLAELRAGARPEEIEDARQTVNQAQARLDYARKEHEKVRSMASSGGATQSEMDLAISRLQVAEAELKRAQSRLQLLLSGTRQEQISQAESELKLAVAEVNRCEALRDKYTLRAPHGGTITAKYINPGEVVSPGQVLLQLDNLDALEIRAAAQETQLAGIEPNGHAQVLADAYPDAPVEAVVQKILPRVNPESGTVTVLLSLAEPPSVQLMDGMAVDVALVREHKTGIVRVPAEALLGSGQETSVWCRNGRGWARTAVKTGSNDGKWVEIVSGLEAGDVVRIP